MGDILRLLQGPIAQPLFQRAYRHIRGSQKGFDEPQILDAAASFGNLQLLHNLLRLRQFDLLLSHSTLQGSYLPFQIIISGPLLFSALHFIKISCQSVI
eukprot:1125992-Karenia_brevis.AAC.1